MNPLAGRIFMFLARQAGKDNMVVCPSTVLKEEFDKSQSTVFRAVNLLERRP